MRWSNCTAIAQQVAKGYPSFVRREISQLVREGATDFHAEPIQGGREPVWSITFNHHGQAKAVLLWRVEVSP